MTTTTIKNIATGETVASFEMIQDQLAMMQTYGRKGEIGNAKACLNAAKEIFHATKDCDDLVKANTEFLTTNFAHFSRMIG